MHMRLICPVHLYRIHYGTTFNVSVVLYLIFLIYIMKIEGANKRLTVSVCSRLWSLTLGYTVTSNRIGSLGLNENAFQEPCICKALEFYDKDELLHGYFTTVNGNKEFLFLVNNLKNKKLKIITLRHIRTIRPQNRMIRSLCPELNLSQPLVCRLGCLLDSLCQKLLGHEM